MTPPPPFVALRAHVQASGHLLTLRVPAWHWAWRGIALAIVLPPLFGLLAVLASVDGEGVAVPSVVLGGIGGMAFIAGVLLALLSPVLSSRTRVTLDFAQGFVTSARSPYPVPIAALNGLCLARTSQLTSFLALTAQRAGAPSVTLLGPLMPKHVLEASALARWLGESLNVPVDTTSVETPAGGTGSGGSSDHFAGLLCYLPIQGVFVIASLYYVFAARRRPFVRFCAIQSLSQFAFSIVVLTVILVVLGVPLGLSEPSPLQTVLIVLLAVALTAYWLWNLGTLVYACYSAYKGRLWVMPWLGPWVRRFLPQS